MAEPPISLDDVDLSSLSEEELERLDALIAAQPSDAFTSEPDSSTSARCDELIRDVIAARIAHQLNPSAPLKTIGRFEALEYIGRGGNGCVFKVFDPKLGRLAALKLCISARAGAGDALMAEAKILAQLEHTNIVTVYDIDQHDGDTFFVMKLVEGSSMHRYATRGEELPRWEELVDLFCVVGEALAAAHDAKIAHGDIKPSNILLDLSTKTPYIADFGHARMTEGVSEREPALGTLTFLAPELHLGDGPANALSDQYAFCVALWACLDRGIPPYRGRDREDFLIETGQASPTVINADVPERVREVLRRGMAREPGERFSTMRELVHQLRLAMGPRLVEPEAAPRGQMDKLNGGLVALVVMLALGLLMQARRPQPEVSEPSHQSKLSGVGCASLPWAPSSSAQSVCSKIRREEFEGANQRWIELHDAMDPRSSDEWATAIGDSLAVAETFLAEGKPITAATWRHIACRDLKSARKLHLASKAEERLSSALLTCD